MKLMTDKKGARSKMLKDRYGSGSSMRLNSDDVV